MDTPSPWLPTLMTMQEDITLKCSDMVRKAVQSFSPPWILLPSHSFSAFCLSVRSLTCKSLNSLEVCFNNILRRIWSLLRNCQRILHCTARLLSGFNLIYTCSFSLLKSALSCLALVHSIFSDSAALCYTFIGFKHSQQYDSLCASIIHSNEHAVNHHYPETSLLW